MYTLILCLLIACLLPYFAKIPVAIAMKNEPGGYNNNEPRMQQAALRGYGGRAVAGHQNSFESLIIYSAAILTALATHHITPVIKGLAIFYLIIRCIYHLMYLFDWAAMRSLIWGISLVISLSIMWLCLP